MSKDKEGFSQLEKDLLAKQQGSVAAAASGPDGQLSQMEQELSAKQRVGSFAVGASSRDTGQSKASTARLSGVENDIVTKQQDGSRDGSGTLGLTSQDGQEGETTIDGFTEEDGTFSDLHEDFQPRDCENLMAGSRHDPDDSFSGSGTEATRTLDFGGDPMKDRVDGSLPDEDPVGQDSINGECSPDGPSSVLEAQPVSEESPKPVFEASALENKGPSCKLLFGGFVFILILVVVAVVTGLDDSSPAPSPSGSPTPSPTTNSEETSPTFNVTGWTLHSSLFGQTTREQFGSGFALSDDGNYLAVAAPFASVGINGTKMAGGNIRVYETVGNEWRQRGDTIEAIAERDLQGIRHGITISGDGSTVLASSTFHNFTGYVRAFQLEGGKWIQRGQTLTGSMGQLFGLTLDISMDGFTFAAGVVNPVLGALGAVRVYRLNKSGTWNQLGDDFVGLDDTGGVGEAVALSSAGDRVAVGDPQFGPGEIRIYDWNGTTWARVGNEIIGNQEDGNFGSLLACSETCDTVLVGSGSSASSSHSARIFALADSGEWEEKGTDLPGPSGPYTVDISSDGNRVAVAWPSNKNSPGEEVGEIRVYDWIDEAWQQSGLMQEVSDKFVKFAEHMRMAGDGNTLVISDPAHDDPTSQGSNVSNSGRLDVFTWPL